MKQLKIGDKVKINPVWEGLPRAGTGVVTWITREREFTPEHIAMTAYGDAYTPARCRPIPHPKYFVRRDNPRDPENPFFITVSTLPLELISEIAPGHNPDKLTIEQVGEGYWLPEWELLEKMTPEQKWDHLETWGGGEDHKWYGQEGLVREWGAFKGSTYRTRLSHEELLKLIIPKKRLIRVEELPAVCWVSDAPTLCKDRVIVTGIHVEQQRLFFGQVPVSVKELHEGNSKYSSDLKTWHSFEVEDKE